MMEYEVFAFDLYAVRRCRRGPGDGGYVIVGIRRRTYVRPPDYI